MITSLWLLLLPLASCDWTNVCPSPSPQAGFYLEGEVVRNISARGQELLVVDSKEREVRLKCDNNQGAVKIYDVEGSNRVVAESFNKTVLHTLWRRNSSSLWQSEITVRCNDCQVRLVNVNDGEEFRSSCRRQSGEDKNRTQLWCNIRDWVQSAFKARNTGRLACATDQHHKSPAYQFLFWSESEGKWQKCGEYDEKRKIVSDDRNVTFISCGLTENQSRESLLVKMKKIHKGKVSSGLPFLAKKSQACEQSTYFIVNQPSEISNSSLTTSVLISLVVCLSVVVVLVLALLWKTKGRRGRKEIVGVTGVCDYAAQMTGDSERRRESGLSTIEDLEFYLPNKQQLTEKPGPGLDRQCSVALEASQRAERLDLTEAEERELNQSAVLDGDPARFNPNLAALAQPRHLHYDRRYERARDTFDIGYMVGQGQYGAVYVGTADGIYGPENTKVAVKQAKQLSDKNQFYTIIDELKILSNLEMHPNLVNLLGACTSNSHLNEVYLLLEYCPFGDLKRFLLDHRERFEASLQNQPGHLESPFNSCLLLTWSYSIARGLEYLSSKQIMHGDLAARNILVAENYVAKISDFGLSKMMYYNQGKQYLTKFSFVCF